MRIILFLLAFLIIVSGGFYYFLYISSGSNIYLFHLIGISSLLFVVVTALELYLYPERRKISNLIIPILFLLSFIFYITDNSPRINFKITPENPKFISEVKVFIEASDDRCLRIKHLPEITGFPTVTFEDLRAFSWIPRFYCPTTYKRVADFINWPDKSFRDSLNDLSEIVIKFSVEDSVGHKTVKQTKFSIPK